MDIEKLIEQLRKSADFEDYPIVASFAAIIEKKYLREAATALSTLQDENEKLRKELEWKDMVIELAQRKEREAKAELEQVTLENNALWTYIEIVDREYRRYMDSGYIDRLDELRRTWRRGQKED